MRVFCWGDGNETGTDFVVGCAGCRQAVFSGQKSLSWCTEVGSSVRSGGARGCEGWDSSRVRMCSRILAMMSGSSMQAITRSLPPHLGQVSMSMEKTRLRRCIHVMGASGLSGAFAVGWRLGTMCSRSLQFGANTPWKRVRQPFVRDGRAGDIAAEFFQLIALFGLTAGRFITKSPGIDPGSSIAARNIAPGTSSSVGTWGIIGATRGSISSGNPHHKSKPSGPESSS